MTVCIRRPCRTPACSEQLSSSRQHYQMPERLGRSYLICSRIWMDSASTNISHFLTYRAAWGGSSSSCLPPFQTDISGSRSWMNRHTISRRLMVYARCASRSIVMLPRARKASNCSVWTTRWYKKSWAVGEVCRRSNWAFPCPVTMSATHSCHSGLLSRQLGLASGAQLFRRLRCSQTAHGCLLLKGSRSCIYNHQ